MTSNRPMLVGLDDRAYLQNSLLAEANFQTIKECFAQNPATDSPIDINNLFAFDTSDKNKVINSIILWAQLLGFSEKNSEVNGNITNFRFLGEHKIPSVKFNSAYYLTAKTGGVFTDKYQNKIYIISTDNPVSRTLLARGYYGNNTDYDTLEFKTANDADSSLYRGDGWGKKLIGLLASNNNGGGKKLIQDLEKFGINQGRRNKPLILFINRDAGVSLIDIGKYAATIAAIIVNVFPGIGQAISTALLTAAAYLEQYSKNPNMKLSASDIMQIGKSLMPSTTEGDSSLWKYAEQGINMYTKYENKDYLGFANELGLGKQFGNEKMFNSLSKDIENNNIMKIRENQTNKMNITEINARVQHVRNMQLPELFAEAATVAPSEAKLIQDIQENGGIKASPEMLKFLVAYAGGAYTSALPTANDKTGEDAIKKIMDADSSWKTSPEIHKALINMAVGLPTGTAAFDELLLAGLENQIKTTGSKVITLPAQLPKEKAQCIAKELSANGYTIYTSEYQLTGKGGNFPLEDAKNAIENGKYYRRVYK